MDSMIGILPGNPDPESRTIGNAAVMSALALPNVTVLVGDSMPVVSHLSHIRALLIAPQDPGVEDGILPGNSQPELDVARTIGNTVVTSAPSMLPNITVAQSVGDRVSVPPPPKAVQDPSTPATTGMMTGSMTTSQYLPGPVVGVVPSMMDVSNDSSSTTGVSIAVTSTQERSILNANITVVSDTYDT
jgi:hypothetical protein